MYAPLLTSFSVECFHVKYCSVVQVYLHLSQRARGQGAHPGRLSIGVGACRACRADEEQGQISCLCPAEAIALTVVCVNQIIEHVNALPGFAVVKVQNHYEQYPEKNAAHDAPLAVQPD